MARGGGIQSSVGSSDGGVTVEGALKWGGSGSAFKEVRDVVGSERLGSKVHERAQRPESRRKVGLSLKCVGTRGWAVI